VINKKFLLPLLLLIISISNSFSQNIEKAASPEKAKMVYMGTFDAGQPNVGIFKMYDPTDDVICYIMTPETVIKKIIDKKTTYEANSIGSISCVKASYSNINDQSKEKKKETDNKTKENNKK